MNASHFRATVICAWGEQGAVAMTKCTSGARELVTSHAFPPEVLVDTLAAGDTFIGSTICQLVEGKSVGDAIKFGCRVAGAKCGMKGLDGIKDLEFLQKQKH